MEARLAHAAAAGDLRAFAALYERHEQAAFSLAFRLTGSRGHASEITRDAFLDALQALSRVQGGGPGFATCLMSASRNGARERSAQGPLTEAGPEPAEGDPQPDSELEAIGHQVSQASFRLPPDEREALALAEMAALSYGQIAAVTDLDPDSVPVLISRARLGLHDELYGTDFAGDPGFEDCDQALTLAAMRDDGQLDDEDDFEWLLEHLAHCAGCRGRLDAMGEAAVAYRRWVPPMAPPALSGETMAAVAQLSGAEPDQIPQRMRAPRRGLVAGGLGATRSVGPTIGGAVSAAVDSLAGLRDRASALAAQGRRQRRPDRPSMATAGLLVLVLGGLSAIAVGATILLQDDDGPEGPVAPAAQAARPSTPAPAPVKEKKRRRPKPRPVKAKPVPAQPQRVVVLQPRPAPQVPQQAPRRGRAAPKKKAPAPRNPRGKVTPAPAPAPPTAPAPAPTPPAQGTPAPAVPPGGAPPPAAPPCNGSTGNGNPC